MKRLSIADRVELQQLGWSYRDDVRLSQTAGEDAATKAWVVTDDGKEYLYVSDADAGTEIPTETESYMVLRPSALERVEQ